MSTLLRPPPPPPVVLTPAQAAAVAAQTPATITQNVIDILKKPVGPLGLDFLYLLNILQYIGLTYTTVVLFQAEKITDTKYCLKNFSKSDKKFFDFLGYYMGFSVALLPLIVMSWIYFNKSKLKQRLVESQLMYTSKTSIIFIAVSILILIALAILLFVYLGILGEVKIEENEEGGYCLEFDNTTDYNYVKSMNWLAWITVIFTTCLIIYL